MKANLQLLNTDAIEATMTITMPIWQWKAVAAACNNRKHPTAVFDYLVSALITKAIADHASIHEGER